MLILVFTEGTAIMHAPGSKDDEKDFFKRHVPTKGAVEKIRTWRKAGAKIAYLTSRTEQREITQIRFVLRKFDFSRGRLFFRKKGEHYYNDVVARIGPDVWVDDDCAGIGGHSPENGYLPLNPSLKILEVIIPEFGGLENLPDNPEELLKI